MLRLHTQVDRRYYADGPPARVEDLDLLGLKVIYPRVTRAAIVRRGIGLLLASLKRLRAQEEMGCGVCGVSRRYFRCVMMAVTMHARRATADLEEEIFIVFSCIHDKTYMDSRRLLVPFVCISELAQVHKAFRASETPVAQSYRK